MFLNKKLTLPILQKKVNKIIKSKEDNPDNITANIELLKDNFIITLT